MQNNKEWWETKEGVWGIFLLGIGVGDMLGRLSSMIGFPLDTFIILLGIYFIFKARAISHQSKISQFKETNDSDIINPSISKISSPEPSNKLSIFQVVRSDWIPLTLTAIVFFWSLFEVIYLGIHKASFNPLGLALFVICYESFPIAIWYYILVLKRKQRLTGRSKVYQSTSFTYKADTIKEVFNRCYKVLDIMRANPPLQMYVDFNDNNKQATLKRPVKSSNLVVIINRIENRDYNIDVSSDAQRLEVEFDFGKNKRNIMTFKKLMLSKKL